MKVAKNAQTLALLAAEKAIVMSDANQLGLAQFAKEIQVFATTIEGFRSNLRELHSNKLGVADFRDAEEALQLRIEALQQENVQL